MSKAKRIVVAILLLAFAVICWVVPDPLPVIDEIFATLVAIGGIGTQIRKLTMKEQ